MKLQKLTIHNIASIEDAVIDFDTQPLADREVFLIPGKTGAGKSTILDAICLALFADTPRLEGTLMEGKTKDEERSIPVSDPRQLMRRNTGEAYVTLTFTGSNGVHYEATWSVKRAYRKVTGNLQDKEWSLKNLDRDYTFDKVADIKAEISAIQKSLNPVQKSAAKKALTDAGLPTAIKSVTDIEILKKCKEILATVK